MVLEQSLFSNKNTITITITITITNTIIPRSYSLDSNIELNILGLRYLDTYNSLIFPMDQDTTIEERIKIIDNVINSLDSTARKGYLNTTDLTDFITFPIVSDLLPSFLPDVNSIETIAFVNGKKSMESYKWIYNIIILTLYYFALDTIQRSSKDLEVEVDLITDLKTKERILFSRIDTSIRHHLSKHGLSISQNTYVGFDTEFNKEDIAHNTLISAQLAVTSRVSIKIPRNPRYQISTLDVDKNKLHRLKQSSEIFNYSKVESTIQTLIERIKRVKFGNYEETLFTLHECFKEVKGIRYNETEEYTMFTLPHSAIQPYFEITDRFSMKELVKIASKISTPQKTLITKIYSDLINFICVRKISMPSLDILKHEVKSFSQKNQLIEKLSSESEQPLPYLTREEIEKIPTVTDKKLSRKFISGLCCEGEKVCITTTNNYYIIAHLTQADLSMLSDFDVIKEELSIVNGSFVTLRDPIQMWSKNIHVRDTMLLAPAGMKSLAQIGRLYDSRYNKILIGKEDLSDMQSFLSRDKEKFVEYAVKDAIISLIHALWMEEFNFNYGCVGIPLSLSAIGRNYVKYVWKESKYSGYQLSSNYTLGNVSSTITPKGLNQVKEIGFLLPYYIANYKGGRNECFMYGIERETLWYDYDLTSAYTSVMSLAGDPAYELQRRLTKKELGKLSADEILYSYLIIHTDFEFPSGTKYPSIPCFVDENCTVFPLTGSAVLSGAEYLLAKSQGCKFKMKDINIIPFRKSEYSGTVKPFEMIIKQVQEKRREYPKGTLNNLMYKEIGNSIYGSVVRGMGDKKKFDIKTKTTQRLVGDELSNPIIASWTTSFIRSIIGECLHAVNKIGGKVVSVTTDGFITNIPNLESRISENYLLTEYKKVRKFLSDDDSSLELKNEGRGIIAWSTRGQLGIESKIIATTGFQHNIYPNRLDLIDVFSQIFNSQDKTVEYVQTRLRSAKDVYQKGGHVTMVYKDQRFRLHFDNKRVLDVPLLQECGELLDSEPLKNISEGENLRFIGKLTKVKQYSRFSNISCNEIRYEEELDLAVINFVKGLVAEPPMFNLHRVGLEKYRDIILYLKEFQPHLKLTENSIASLKKRSIQVKSVPKNKACEVFVNYIRKKFKTFDEESFFRSV